MRILSYKPIQFLLDQQIIRFGIVGSSAAFVNMIIVVLIVELLHWHPLSANLVGFLCSFNISYFGHRGYTFHGDVSNSHAASIPRFLMIALMGLFMTEGLFYIFLHHLHIYYVVSLILVIGIVASINFMLGKYWAFS
ncbi:MAG: GtrA family protein [Gammaproteobacteria bacterium]|nr:GtrA family protein [Gammaproteobacteria bacterium]MCH9744618.1 GtrA family protein [Gammaproteobacteria bacterium]